MRRRAPSTRTGPDRLFWSSRGRGTGGVPLLPTPSDTFSPDAFYAYNGCPESGGVPRSRHRKRVFAARHRHHVRNSGAGCEQMKESWFHDSVRRVAVGRLSRGFCSHILRLVALLDARAVRVRPKIRTRVRNPELVGDARAMHHGAAQIGVAVGGDSSGKRRRLSGRCEVRAQETMVNDVRPTGVRRRNRRAFEKETPRTIQRRADAGVVGARNGRRRVLRRAVLGKAVLAGANRFEKLRGNLVKRKRTNGTLAFIAPTRFTVTVPETTSPASYALASVATVTSYARFASEVVSPTCGPPGAL